MWSEGEVYMKRLKPGGERGEVENFNKDVGQR